MSTIPRAEKLQNLASPASTMGKWIRKKASGLIHWARTEWRIIGSAPIVAKILRGDTNMMTYSKFEDLTLDQIHILQQAFIRLRSEGVLFGVKRWDEFLDMITARGDYKDTSTDTKTINDFYEEYTGVK